MADITVTAAKVAPVYPAAAEIYDFIAAEAITKGQAVYLTTSGTVGVADANVAAKDQFRGIALETVGAAQAVSVLKRGHVYGYTLTDLAYDGLAYLSNTVGALADAAGSTTVNVGRCVPLPDADLTKVLYIQADWLNDWS